jgi:hypothetical protein
MAAAAPDQPQQAPDRGRLARAVRPVLGATCGLVRLGGAIYSGALLRTGAKPRFRDLWDAARAR